MERSVIALATGAAVLAAVWRCDSQCVPQVERANTLSLGKLHRLSHTWNFFCKPDMTRYPAAPRPFGDTGSGVFHGHNLTPDRKPASVAGRGSRSSLRSSPRRPMVAYSPDHGGGGSQSS